MLHIALRAAALALVIGVGGGIVSAGAQSAQAAPPAQGVAARKPRLEGDARARQGVREVARG